MSVVQFRAVPWRSQLLARPLHFLRCGQCHRWLGRHDISRAHGDGVVDDTYALQQRLDRGGVITFPPGEYVARETLRLDTGAQLTGRTDDHADWVWPRR